MVILITLALEEWHQLGVLLGFVSGPLVHGGLFCMLSIGFNSLQMFIM